MDPFGWVKDKAEEVKDLAGDFVTGGVPNAFDWSKDTVTDVGGLISEGYGHFEDFRDGFFDAEADLFTFLPKKAVKATGLDDLLKWGLILSLVLAAVYFFVTRKA